MHERHEACSEEELEVFNTIFKYCICVEVFYGKNNKWIKLKKNKRLSRPTSLPDNYNYVVMLFYFKVQQG